jgi:hypothetical protein
MNTAASTRPRGSSPACSCPGRGSRSSCITPKAPSSPPIARGWIRAIHAPDIRATFLAGNAFVLNLKLAGLKRAHPNDTLVASLAQHLPVRAAQGGREKAAIWTAVEEALWPERTVLEALDACCVAPEELDGWLGPLRQFCAVAPVSILRKPNGDPIAWCIEGTRPSEA